MAENSTPDNPLTLQGRFTHLLSKLLDFPLTLLRRSSEARPDPLAADFSFTRPFQITIDGLNYQAIDWRTVESAEVLERNYDKGFIGGAGVFSEDAQTGPGQFYMARNLDCFTYPYLRLRPKTIRTTLGDVDGQKPTYFFVDEDSGGREYLYVLQDRFAKKYDIAANALDETKDFGAGAVCGQPILYEGFWRVPLGETVRAVHLATVAVPVTLDAWTSVANTDEQRFFTHYAHHQSEGVAQVAASHNDDPVVSPNKANQVSFSASLDTPAFGDSVEVGDSTLEITGLQSVAGQIFVAKPDAPWRLSNDGGGNAYPIMEFVGKQKFLSGYTGEDGARSASAGPYFYWTSSSGLWRIIGDNARPIDVASNRRFTGIALDALTPSFLGRWNSMATWGRWAYATDTTTGLWQGYIEEDGSITWGANLLNISATMNVGIVGTKDNPLLFVLDPVGIGGRLFHMELEEDGSTRKILTPGQNRGNGEGAAESGQIWMPETTFGQNGEKNLQLRGGWLEVDDLDAECTLTLRVHRDRAVTSTVVGASITNADGDGRHELKMTPGTNDTFRRLIPALRMAVSSDWDEDNGDVRVRGFGFRCVTPHVYAITIPLDGQAMRGSSSSRFDAIRNLRNLKSGFSVTVKEPGLNATFTGYITDVQEQVQMVAGQPSWALVLRMERWVL